MKYSIFYIITGVFLIDQLSKWLISHYMDINTSIYILPIFNLVHIRNQGISFGLLSNNSPYGAYLLALLSCCVICLLLFLAFKSVNKYQKVAFSLIIGGALGNVWDRITDKAVTDFLDFYFKTYHWPAFNLADVVIVCGAGLLMLESLLSRQELKKHE